MLADRVLHTSTITGTGTYDLIDPSSALYLSAVASVGSGNRLTYAVEMGSSWEICWGVVTAGSPATLTRNLIRSSTGALINWGAGTKTLYSISQADIVRFGGRGSLPTSAGTANAQTLAHVTPLRSLQAGMEVVFVPGANNTGATTLAVDSLGAIAVLAPGGAACVGGELRSGVPAQAIYNGTSWRLVSYSPSATGAALLAAADAAAARTTIGATATGTAVLTAANAAAGLSALGGLPLTGGSITGGLTLSNDLVVDGSDIFIRGAANNNLWFQDAAANERGVVWYDNATGTMRIRTSGGPNSVSINSSGHILSSMVSSNYWFRNDTSGGRMTMNVGNDLEFHWNSGFYYRIDGNSYVLINASPSDARYKERVSSLTDGLSIVSALRPVRYTYKHGIPVAVPEGERVGFLLQEARQVMPSLGHEVGVPGEDAEHKFLAYQQDDDKQLIAVLIRAVQQQQEQINALKVRIAALEG